MVLPIVPSSNEEVRKTLELLKSVDLSTADIDVLKEILIPIFKGYMKVGIQFDAGLDLYRGVKCSKIPDKIQNLSYPPKEKTKNNRASREGYSMFYCSTLLDVPFFELDVKPGDTIALSKWKTTDELMINNVGYSLEFSKLNSNRSNPEYGKEINHPEKPEWNSLVDEFLDVEFTKIVSPGFEHLYKLSIAIAEKLFAADLFDGLLYPTIAMRANADNFAIKPSYVDKKMRFINVRWYRIDSKQDFRYQVTEIDFANSFKVDGTIEWKGRKGQWILRKQGEKLTIKAENGMWIAQDDQGNIVEPE